MEIEKWITISSKKSLSTNTFNKKIDKFVITPEKSNKIDMEKPRILDIYSIQRYLFNQKQQVDKTFPMKVIVYKTNSEFTEENFKENLTSFDIIDCFIVDQFGFNLYQYVQEYCFYNSNFNLKKLKNDVIIKDNNFVKYFYSCKFLS